VFTYYEFFSGAGMVRVGLGAEWDCLFANDFDPKKAAIYRQNFDPGLQFVEEDIACINSIQVAGVADLAWASFPCQDLSLAGKGYGLGGNRSSTYWHFWRIISDKVRQGKPVPIVAIENVPGLISSHRGRDFSAVLNSLYSEGYYAGAFIVDASLFVPQSRSRVFIVAAHDTIKIDNRLLLSGPSESPFYPKRLVDTVFSRTHDLRSKWIWWSLPLPKPRVVTLADVIDWDTDEVELHSPAQTSRLVSQMSETHLAQVRKLVASGATAVGAIYRRTRPSSDGGKIQRAEVRFDGLSGALRTPIGGSSRQIIMLISDGKISTRLLAPREAARLMGLPESYRLPHKYNDAYHLLGDGVVVDVVRWLASNLFECILDSSRVRCGVA